MQKAAEYLIGTLLGNGMAENRPLPTLFQAGSDAAILVLMPETHCTMPANVARQQAA